MSFDPMDLWRSSPLLLLSVAGMLVLLLDAFSRVRLVGKDYHKRMPAETSEAYAMPIGGSRAYLMPLTMLCFAMSLVLLYLQWDDVAGGQLIYRRMLVVDRFGLFASAVCIVAGAMGAVTAPSFLRAHRLEFGEYYALLLLSVAGMMILVLANDLVTLFLGLETLSLGVYVLTGSYRRSARSSEAAMKYFLVGAFVSAVLLYGIALIYGAAGTTDLLFIQNRLGSLTSRPLFILGVFFVLASFAFKISAVPFHMWAPDTYEGAPTPVTGFMMSAVKAAGFAALMRFCLVALKGPEMTNGPTGWVQIFWWLAVLTMSLGNLAALRQDNIKRMMAYSSISHAGYLLVGLVALGQVGDEARGPLLFYLMVYAVNTVGAMAVVGTVGLGYKNDERLRIDDWAGLATTRPWLALAMAVFMLSLGGFPPTAGFFGKFYVFRAALMKPGLVPLVLIAVVNSGISIFYYLRVVTSMYFRAPVAQAFEQDPAPAGTTALLVTVTVAAVLVLGLGLVPGSLAQLAAAATLGG